ncbi:MarR family transcriptional regulator [Sulfurimonas sp. C5]|uniref:MarR family winged helix-turn-helix transcriptional regulator n=1 Tax=Sulfurimonas sp. C5 TaxID=3036947 RepID=UPI0024564348|nr:MarR family transcriptional regulator [Sulfurimonas sp. C5]MDH4944154.1 MarR family transcriptional regulator [Sulfurimonas sp. C5]
MEKEEFNFQESYGYHFISTSVVIKRLIESRIQEYDLTHLQFSILMNLYRNNTTTQKELLKYVYGDEASVTRLIDRLESKGYLKRVQSQDDKRKKNISLTEEGRFLVQKLVHFAKEVNQELIKDLDQDEAEEFLRLLQKVSSSLDKV